MWILLRLSKKYDPWNNTNHRHTCISKWNIRGCLSWLITSRVPYTVYWFGFPFQMLKQCKRNLGWSNQCRHDKTHPLSNNLLLVMWFRKIQHQSKFRVNPEMHRYIHAKSHDFNSALIRQQSSVGCNYLYNRKRYINYFSFFLWPCMAVYAAP